MVAACFEAKTQKGTHDVCNKESIEFKRLLRSSGSVANCSMGTCANHEYVSTSSQCLARASNPNKIGAYLAPS